MPVKKVIEVDGERLRVLINANNKVAIVMEPTAGNDADMGCVMELDSEDLAEFIRMCKAVQKEIGNG